MNDPVALEASNHVQQFDGETPISCQTDPLQFDPPCSHISLNELQVIEAHCEILSSSLFEACHSVLPPEVSSQVLVGLFRLGK